MAGEVLRRERHARDISRKDLAAHAGISPQRLSAIETDKKPGVQYATFVLLAGGLDLPEDEWGRLLSNGAAVASTNRTTSETSSNAA
jgi:transcriptional regulator with XRE-family HTH domain